MKKTEKSLWYISAQAFAIMFMIYIIITAITAAVIAPTDAHKEVLQSTIEVNREIASSASYSTSDTTPAQQESIELREREAGKEVSLTENISGSVSFIVLLFSCYFVYRFIAKRTRARGIEPAVTLVAALAYIVAALLAPLVLNSIVGTNDWVAATYGSWWYWIGVIANLAITLFMVGVVVHIIHRRHKQNHSFEIE